MTDYNPAEGQSSVTEDRIDLSKRAVRSLTEKMTVLPEMGRAKHADDLYLVVSGSGSKYLVDTRECVCECPDFQYREPENGCKHIYRTRYAVGEEIIPEWVQPNAIDPHLGKHTDATVRCDSSATLSRQNPEKTTTSEDKIQTDGGVAASRDESNACRNGDERCDGPTGEELPCFDCFEVDQ